jgi:peptidase A4-like protein
MVETPKEIELRKILVTLVAAAATAASVVTPAAAAASTVVKFAPAHIRIAPARAKVSQQRGFNINGYNWGGYAATGSGFTSVSATWTEPAATCSSTNDLYAPWVGIDGYGSSTVEQTGVQTDCSSGSPVDSMWYELYPANPVYPSTSTYPVVAGNVIHASAVYTGSKFTLMLQNVSKGWTYTVTKAVRSAKRVSAEVIIESPTAAYPNFGTVNFSSATVNGTTLGSFNPVAMDPSTGSTYEAHTSALTGGTAFSIAYEHQ